MERSVVVGGLLVSVSLLLAMTLNGKASRDATSIDAASAERASNATVIAQANNAAQLETQGETGPTPEQDEETLLEHP